MDKLHDPRTSTDRRDAKDPLLPDPQKTEADKLGKTFQYLQQRGVNSDFLVLASHSCYQPYFSSMSYPSVQASPFPVVLPLSPRHLLHGGPISTCAHSPESPMLPTLINVGQRLVGTCRWAGKVRSVIVLGSITRGLVGHGAVPVAALPSRSFA